MIHVTPSNSRKIWLIVFVFQSLKKPLSNKNKLRSNNQKKFDALREFGYRKR